ncbi:MAG: hypothetical protein R2753_11925 [Chitinophagales bacterium]
MEILDSNPTPVSNWNEVGFNDASWSLGGGDLGFEWQCNDN